MRKTLISASILSLLATGTAFANAQDESEELEGVEHAPVDVQEHVLPTFVKQVLVSGIKTSLLWNAEMNDVNKRLGDLHFKSGEHGLWARTYGGAYKTKFTNDGLSYKTKSNFYAAQVGYDQALTQQVTAGLALSYIHAKGKLDEASSKGKAFALTAYSTFNLTDNDYLDLVGKFGRVSSKDQNINPHTWGYAVSAEYGHRFNLTDNFFVTPNAEVSFAHLGKMTLIVDKGHSMDQAKINTWAARVGANVGYTYSTGSVAVNVSYKREFKNDVKYIHNNDGEFFKINLGGNKLVLGVKGTQQLNDKLYVYYGAEKSFLSKNKLEWRADVGVRYNF